MVLVIGFLNLVSVDAKERSFVFRSSKGGLVLSETFSIQCPKPEENMYAQDSDLKHIFGDVAKILQHEIFQNHIWYFFYFTKKV